MAALTLQQLRVLLAVLDHRSFTRGAQAVFMTQSAASQHVRSLEQALGTPLVERIGGDVLPTRAGSGLAHYAREMLRVAGDAERFIAAVRDGSAGRLAIGACGSAVYLVPILVSAFRAARIGAEVTLHVAPREGLCRALAGGELDLGLMSEPVPDGRLVHQELCPDRLVLVAPPASPLLPAAALAPLPLERLAEQAIIASSTGAPSWAMVEAHAREQGVSLRPSLRLDSVESIKKAVEAGLGVAFLSAWVVEREVALGTLRVLPLAGPPLTRTFRLVRHATRYTDGLLQGFIDRAPEYLARHLPAALREPQSLQSVESPSREAQVA